MTASKLVAIDDFLQNFPNRPIAWILRLLIFPTGKAFKRPSDKLGHAVSNILLAPSAARDRLTDGIYKPSSINDPLGRVEDALPKVIAAEPLEKRIRIAIKAKQIEALSGDEATIGQALQNNVISNDEAEILRTAKAVRNIVIKVDDFSPDLKSEQAISL